MGLGHLSLWAAVTKASSLCPAHTPPATRAAFTSGALGKAPRSSAHPPAGSPWGGDSLQGFALGRRQGAPQCRAPSAARPGERGRGGGPGVPPGTSSSSGFGAACPPGTRLGGGRRVEQLLHDSNRSTLLLAGFFQYFFFIQTVLS